MISKRKKLPIQRIGRTTGVGRQLNRNLILKT
jgi:hypothetical protein